MQVITKNTLEEIEVIVDRFRSPFSHLLFRGEACNNCNWKLRPSLIRDENMLSVERLLQEEIRFNTEFKRRIIDAGLQRKILEGQNPLGFQSQWEWLTQAQHYGLPTRLFDWSIDFRRALYFAVDDTVYDKNDGQLWIYQGPNGIILSDNPIDSDIDYRLINPAEITHPVIVNVTYQYKENHAEYTGQERKWHQMGQFLVQPNKSTLIPMEENRYFRDDLIKIIIPHSEKKTMREQLKASGLTKEYLYGEKNAEVEKIIFDLKRFRETI